MLKEEKNRKKEEDSKQNKKNLMEYLHNVIQNADTIRAQAKLHCVEIIFQINEKSQVDLVAIENPQVGFVPKKEKKPSKEQRNYIG